MANLHNAEFKKANVSGAQFQGVPVPGTQISERSWLIWPASLENTDFRGANLFRADFRGCYFYGTKLEGAYIRGADITIDTHLGDADWGNYVIGEEKNKEFYFAEHRYRHLKMWYTHAGYYGIAAKFYYREKEASRKSLRWYSRHRLALEFLRALFGYGEGWKRVLVSIAVLILLFALTYCAIGSAWEWSAFGNSLYFSAVSFTALGYGSWVQATNGWMKGIGAFESLVGVSMMALLLVTFFRKWTR